MRYAANRITAKTSEFLQKVKVATFECFVTI